MNSIAVAYICLMTTAGADAAQHLTPNMVRHDIAEFGAKAIVNKLYEANASHQVEDNIRRDLRHGEGGVPHISAGLMPILAGPSFTIPPQTRLD